MLNKNLLNNITNQVQELLIKKNSDYGNSYFELRSEFGNVAFIVRIVDKIARLKTLIKNQAKVEETEEDTIKDIIYYRKYYGGKDGMD